MAASVYVYENLDTYMQFYKHEEHFLTSALKILDMYLKNEQLFVIVDSTNLLGRPDMTRSFVVMDKNMKEKFFNGDEILVKHGDVSFNFKNSKLFFMKKMFRKPKLSIKVDRYFGENRKKHQKINTVVRFYDFPRNRVVLIQK